MIPDHSAPKNAGMKSCPSGRTSATRSPLERPSARKCDARRSAAILSSSKLRERSSPGPFPPEKWKPRSCNPRSASSAWTTPIIWAARVKACGGCVKDSQRQLSHARWPGGRGEDRDTHDPGHEAADVRPPRDAAHPVGLAERRDSRQELQHEPDGEVRDGGNLDQPYEHEREHAAAGEGNQVGGEDARERSQS